MINNIIVTVRQTYCDLWPQRNACKGHNFTACVAERRKSRSFDLESTQVHNCSVQTRLWHTNLSISYHGMFPQRHNNKHTQLRKLTVLISRTGIYSTSVEYCMVDGFLNSTLKKKNYTMVFNISNIKYWLIWFQQRTKPNALINNNLIILHIIFNHGSKLPISNWQNIPISTGYSI